MTPTTNTLKLVPAAEGSELELSLIRVEPGGAHVAGDADADTMLYVTSGAGSLFLDEERVSLDAGTAALVLAGETATIETMAGLSALGVTVGPGADRHAPLGPRETVARLTDAGSQTATGARSFEVLFGPHNGSTRATLFAGYIPPGRAPWHYHLYDEIVWVPAGPGRLHRVETVEELEAGSAFRLRPRELHIVENSSPDVEMTIFGVFTPAGSPSAAFLTPGAEAAYTFGG